MKKKIMMLAFGISVMGMMAAGCGRSAGDTDSTEAVEDTETAESTEAASAPAYADDIQYDASEYVTLGDYSGIDVLVSGDYEVTDDDVKQEIEAEIASASPYYVAGDKKNVEDGDVVNIDFVGKMDGEAFSGGTGEDYNLEIGSGSFIDGFESGLIGSSVGDTLDLDLSFPEVYDNNPDLAGQPVTFTVTVNAIMDEQEMSYDLLNDDYASSVMKYDTADEYIAAVRSSLETNAESGKSTDTQQAILDRLLEVCEVSGYPEGLVEKRIEQRKDYFETYAASYGLEMADFLAYYAGTTEEELDAQLQETMPNTVSQEMILLAVADKEGITDDEDGYQEYIANIISQNGFPDEDSLYQQYDENYVRRMYRQDTALNFVKEHANIKYEGTEAAGEDTEA